MQLAHPPCIASSSLDGVILIWDIVTYDKLAQLYDVVDHLNGVQGI